MLLDTKKNIHFVGIGGIGMSAIARVLLEMGYKVSGSDLELNNLTRRMASCGARIFEGHRGSNLPEDSSLLVYSSSIAGDNPEFKKAVKKKIRIAHRAEVLGELFNKKKGIGVTGTHGKTTTTSLISVMLKKNGYDPTVIIGGEVDEFEGNGALGTGAYLVAEADESDSSFLNLHPHYAVITNIEMEHVDHFKTLDAAKKAYRSFADNVKNGGKVFYNIGDPNLADTLKGFSAKRGTFGFSKNADIYPSGIRMDGFRTTFKCVYKGDPIGSVELNIPGRHNILNALAAILVGLEMGVDFKNISGSLKDFKGARRRFQLRVEEGGVMLIDDYAHHPTEIRAVLSACRNWKGKRIIAVFQPHRYTRTFFLAEDFGRCFKGADKLILTDIYAASEEPIKGVSIKNISDKCVKNGLDDIVVMDKGRIPAYVMKIKRHGDIILVLGAGDIKNTADRLYEMLTENRIRKFKRSFKGKLETRKALSSATTFRIGGPVDVWAEPRDIKDLRKLLAFAGGNKMPLFVIGNGSNILAGDSGFKGIALRLKGPSFERLSINGSDVRVGAGYSLAKLVRTACGKGLSGLESLVGIPGTVGGAIFMNAGGSANPIFKNIGELVRSLKVMDYEGGIKNLDKDEILFGYRCSNLNRFIILEAGLRLERSGREILLSSVAQFLKMKKDKQVLDMPSAGCIFKNPKDFQFTCGQMIDMLGLKGKRIGGAEISPRHANFIVNRGGATCNDVKSLIRFIQDKAKSNYGVDLELEVKVI